MVDVPRPPLPRQPIIQPNGFASREFTQFIELLWRRTGGEVDAVAQQNSLSPGNLGALVPEEYGAVGDGVTNDTSAFTRFLIDCHTLGRPGVLQGRYLVPDLDRFTLTSHVSLIGLGNNAYIDGGTGVKLFLPQSAGFTFHNIETRNVTLADTFRETTGDLDAIDIYKWRWTNDDILSCRIRWNYEDDPYKIGHVRLMDIQGNGGLGGVEILVPGQRWEVDNYVVRNIVVPDDDAHFTGDDMINSGYADGLNLGGDDQGAQEITEYCTVGSVTIDGLVDHRVKRNGGGVSSADGFRCVTGKMTAGEIHVRNVTSHQKEDCTAFYSKTRDSRIGLIHAINAGHYEACVVFKGARRGSGIRSPGWNVHVGQIMCINTEGFSGRPALYLGTDDIRIDSLYLEGMGGDLEDQSNPGQRKGGQGPLVYCQQNTTQGRLSIGSVVALNCVMGSTQTIRPFLLAGYNEIDIGSCFLDGLSNAGKFSTQGVGDEQNLHVFAFVEQFTPRKSVRIGPVILRNTEHASASYHVVNSRGLVDLNQLILDGFTIEDTPDFGIVLSNNGGTVGYLEAIGGDWRNCTSVTSFSTEPTRKRFIGPPLGLVPDAPGTANLASAQSVPTGTETRVQYTNSNADGWSDTNFELTLPEDGNWAFDATVTVRPNNASNYQAVLRLKRDRGGSVATLDEVMTNIKTDAAPGATEESLRVHREFQLLEGDEIFVTFEHDLGSNAQVSATGGGVANRIDWSRRA